MNAAESILEIAMVVALLFITFFYIYDLAMLNNSIVSFVTSIWKRLEYYNEKLTVVDIYNFALILIAAVYEKNNKASMVKILKYTAVTNLLPLLFTMLSYKNNIDSLCNIFSIVFWEAIISLLLVICIASTLMCATEYISYKCTVMVFT